jgi:hypothetical protein
MTRRLLDSTARELRTKQTSQIFRMRLSGVLALMRL